ncbi:MAG: uracil-DNA glycosylase [Pseudomonadota bacterium]
MAWTERQQAMLRAMGLVVWSPPPAGGVAGEASVADPAPNPEAVEHLADRVSTPPPAVPAPAARPAPAQAPVRPAPPRAGMGEVAGMDWPTLRAAVASCQACKLCESRTQTVFGVGHPNAHWMIVGEAPGEQEDLKGEPFVGAAGQLLDAMLAALGLSRSEGPPERQVFIANTLKCRPPRNRNPEPEELASCEPFLRRQIELVQPRVILAMGRFALQLLLRSDDAVGRLRGRVHTYEGVPLVVTYHPAYLLRQPADKAKAWEDLCLAASLLER